MTAHAFQPISEADFPPEQYAYRPGRNPNRRGQVEERCSVVTRKLVDADLRSYFGKHPHAELLQS